jgi:O-antigen ligase
MNYRRIVRRKTTLAIATSVIATGAVLGIVLLDRPLIAYQDRWLLYSTVWRKVSANLWQGTGFGHETDQAWYRATFDHFAVPGVPDALTHPHNIVLSYMDQMGVWGLLMLVCIFWTIGQSLWSAMRSGGRWQVKLGQAGMLLLLVTFVSNSFNFYFARQHLWMLFAMLGLYFGWIRGERRPL